MSSFDPVILANYGVLGFVVGWFMFRSEKTLKEITEALVQLDKTLVKVCTKLDVEENEAHTL